LSAALERLDLASTSVTRTSMTQSVRIRMSPRSSLRLLRNRQRWTGLLS
jgi:hypothetical protein